MKKLFFFAAAIMMSLSITATTAKINPTWEGNYRTNNATPTGWTKVTTSDAQFEVSNNSRFFAVQTWTIANISKVDSLEFVYQRVSGQTNNGDVSMWFFPYTSMVTSTADYATAGVAFLNDVKTVLGVYPGNAIDEEHQPFRISTSRDAEGVHSRVIALDADGVAALKAAGTVENDYLTVTVLLNTLNSTSNYKYYHTGENASYCMVTYEGEIVVPAILNNTSHKAYADSALALAVEEANAGDVLTINEDIAISGSRLEIKKALTIQGANDTVKLICDVPYNSLMVLANDTTDYTVTFKNLIVDGQNAVRDRQLFDLNNKAKMAFDGVRVINTSYSAYEVCDVKTAGSNVVLSGLNSFPAGIALNKNKRVDHQGATHSEPIRLVLAGDYVADYAIVLHCADSTLYTAVDAAGEAEWELYVSNGELKGRKVQKEPEPEAIYNTMVETKALKVLRNGQMVIIRDDKMYNVLGTQL